MFKYLIALYVVVSWTPCHQSPEECWLDVWGYPVSSRGRRNELTFMMQRVAYVPGVAIHVIFHTLPIFLSNRVPLLHPAILNVLVH